MRTSMMVGFAVTALLLSSAAFAQEEKADSSARLTAPNRALEISGATGYGQGFGNVAQGRTAGLNDLSRGSLTSQLAVGYRLNPQLLIGGYGEFGRYARGDSAPRDSSVFSAAAGAQAQYHFMPFNRIDPWVGLGAGWRGYWVAQDDAGTHSMHGIDIVRAQVGVAYRVNSQLSISPVIGATMTMFLSEQRSDQTELHSVSDPRMNAFVFVGLMSRFDIGGQVTEEQTEVASR